MRRNRTQQNKEDCRMFVRKRVNCMIYGTSMSSLWCSMWVENGSDAFYFSDYLCFLNFALASVTCWYNTYTHVRAHTHTRVFLSGSLLVISKWTVLNSALWLILTDSLSEGSVLFYNDTAILNPKITVILCIIYIYFFQTAICYIYDAIHAGIAKTWLHQWHHFTMVYHCEP
jgi:hypothetical protein